MFWSTLLFGELNHTVSMILVDPFDIYSYTLDRSMFWSTLLFGGLKIGNHLRVSEEIERQGMGEIFHHIL